MQRKFRSRTRQRTRIGVRTILYAATFCSALVLTASFFIVQLLKDEEGMAASNPMVISNIEVSQDTLPVYRGTTRQVMLRVKIISAGNTNRLNFNSITLAARGTSKDAINMINNARLWYTGSQNHFSTSQQIGTTQEKISNDNFIISGIKPLTEGSNYFWLTYDINDSKIYGDLVVDAECINVRIGTLEYDPSIAAPPGARAILQNKPYYSSGNGDISSLDSWNTSRDGSGTTPLNFNELSATFSIQPGQIMKNELLACIPVLIIENGGVLNSKSGIKANRVEVFPGGTYVQETEIKNNENIGQFILQNNANYIHANNGILPGYKRQINKNSNIIITKCSDLTFTENIKYGNLIIDYDEGKDIDFNNSLKYIRGDLEIRKTGNDNTFYTSTNDTITIEGDLVVNGGNLSFGSNGNNLILNVGKGISIKKGSLTDKIHSRTTGGNLQMHIGNSVAVLAGELNLSGKYSSISVTETKSIWIQQELATVKLCDINIKSGATLSVKSNIIGNIAANRKMLVENGGTLECNNAVITGDGIFEVAAGGSISTSHNEGIYSEGNYGCVQTAERIYSTEISIIYTGTTSPQYSGIFNTGKTGAIIKNFTLLKSSIAGIVVLNQNITVTGTFFHQRGNLNKNSFSLNREKPNEAAMLTP